MAKSTGTSAGRKPPKFPLNLHQSGQYRKRIRGRDYYFGTDADQALEQYHHDRPFLEKGLQPPPMGADIVVLKELCNQFLSHKKSQVQTGEITNRTFKDYYRSCELLLGHFGKTLPITMVDAQLLTQYRAKLAETRGPVALGNEVARVRVLFNYAFANDLLDRPVKFGEFKKPSRKALRRQRAQQPKKLFDAIESLMLIGGAKLQMRAMVLLALNGGLGNRECGELKWQSIDLDSGWLNYPRPKTGAPRRVPLWPETVQALSDVQASRCDGRPELVFLTKYGQPWFSDDKANPIGHEFRKLQQKAGIHVEGRGFYSLRHTFCTIAEETRDFPAVRLLMGHADGDDIADHYREDVSDSRLQRVTDYVRTWLYGGAK